MVPSQYGTLTYKYLHTEMAHLGTERVLNLSRECFFWQRMQHDIEHFITKVCKWIKQMKSSVRTMSPMQHVRSTAPFQMISIDNVHLKKSRGGYEYIWVILDNFTKCAQAYPTRNKSGKTAAKILCWFFSQGLALCQKSIMIREESLKISYSEPCRTARE